MTKTMKKTTTEHQTETAPNTSVRDALSTIEGEITTLVTLNRKTRRSLATRSGRVSDVLINIVLQEAEKNGGQIAGITIDVPAAREALAAASESQESADSARRIGDRMEDDAIQHRVVVADRAFAVYTALRRLVHTPEGEPLARTYEEMASTVRKKRPKARAKKAQPTPSDPPSPPPPPSPPSPPEAQPTAKTPPQS
jgi:hypothetical protein